MKVRKDYWREEFRVVKCFRCSKDCNTFPTSFCVFLFVLNAILTRARIVAQKSLVFVSPYFFPVAYLFDENKKSNEAGFRKQRCDGVPP